MTGNALLAPPYFSRHTCTQIVPAYLSYNYIHLYIHDCATAVLHDDHDNDHTTNPQPLQLRSSALGLHKAGQDRESSTANNKPLAAAEPISIAPVLREKSADAQRRSYAGGKRAINDAGQAPVPHESPDRRARES